ncbi:MAG: FAD:protein FMN transferase [Archangiaceae bacterium]|nr:FAD:protein FMN transferase [Archangiaceae bacterium]
MMLTAGLALLLSAPGDVAVERAAVVRRSKDLPYLKVVITIANAKPDDALNEAFAAAFLVFEDIEKNLNEWREGSVLQKINAAAGAAEPVDAPPDVCAVVKLALDGAKKTNGLFDPTWAALKEVWSFNGAVEQPLPDPAAVKAACALVSFKDVELKAKPRGECTVRLKKKGMALGLGGIIKGWGVDQAAKALRAKGYRDFFVQAGGDLYVSGKNGERGWKVGIRDPRGPADSSFARGELTDTAFSTSGDYEHFFMNQGTRYHHLLDLRSCRPATASVSATVMAKTAVDAEVLTKATFVLGGAKGLELAKRFGASAVLVDPTGKVHASKGLEGKLELWAPAGFAGPSGAGTSDAGPPAP